MPLSLLVILLNLHLNLWTLKLIFLLFHHHLTLIHMFLSTLLLSFRRSRRSSFSGAVHLHLSLILLVVFFLNALTFRRSFRMLIPSTFRISSVKWSKGKRFAHASTALPAILADHRPTQLRTR